jgi:hypothetical protein
MLDLLFHKAEPLAEQAVFFFQQHLFLAIGR